MMVGVRDVSGVVVAFTERACCRVAVGGSAFGCADSPCGLVACTWEAIVGSFFWTWATNDEGNSTVRCRGPFWSNVGDMRVLRPTPLLS